MTITSHDFTRPPPLAPKVRASLVDWLGRANALLVEQLAAMSVPVQLRLESALTTTTKETLAEWTDKTLAFQIDLGNLEIPSMIAMPNPLVQEIVGRLVGEQPEGQAAERDLTPGEMSIAQFLIESMVNCLRETWIDGTAPELSVGEIEPNLRRTKRFRPTETVVVCRTAVKTPFESSSWCWILSSDFLEPLLGLPSKGSAPSQQSSRRHMEALIREMRAEIGVRLGSVQLSGSELAALRVGDLVVLDQRVSEPLQAMVRGKPKFLGWAGRVGNRQAFEIESEVQSSRQTTETPELGASTTNLRAS